MSHRLQPDTIGAPFFALALLAGIGNAQTPPKQNRTPVLVELFTSEGCSSCPPADALLAKLNHDQPVSDAEIIALSEHVDYWDQLGWHDRFSSSQYTDRQREYSVRLKTDDVYTPQMIVAGTEQFVGNDSAHALRAIAHAALTTKLSLSLSNPVVDGRQVSSSVSIATTPAAQTRGDLYAALVDPIDTTNVLRGENSGHQLRHVDVVRTLKRIGNLKDLNAGPHSFALTAPSGSSAAGMRLIVFAQSSGLGPVLGAASTVVAP